MLVYNVSIRTYHENLSDLEFNLFCKEYYCYWKSGAIEVKHSSNYYILAFVQWHNLSINDSTGWTCIFLLSNIAIFSIIKITTKKTQILRIICYLKMSPNSNAQWIKSCFHKFIWFVCLNLIYCMECGFGWLILVLLPHPMIYSTLIFSLNGNTITLWATGRLFPW